MCGIAGFILAGGDQHTSRNANSILRDMHRAIAHRGPDDAGVVFEAQAGVGLAHRRLAIIDLSASGHQPMLSHCERYTLVFNGEIYNFLELKAEIEATHQFDWRGGSDTEIMLACFSLYGVEASLTRFNGMFALAVWDREQRRLILARDRVGEKPLYYGLVRGAFVFGSELRALSAFPGFSAGVSHEALAAYTGLLGVPAPMSIYEGIFQLPPASLLTLEREALAEGLPPPQLYWDASQQYRSAIANPFGGSFAEATSELDILLRRSVKQRMISDVPLGAFLSGGIDSSLIVALMQAQSAQAVRTFTIGFEDGSFDESPHATAVAKHLGTQHTNAIVSVRQAQDMIQHLPTIYAEPFADSSQIPTAILCALTRQKLTVALSGDAGDELFGGYQRYFEAARSWPMLAKCPLWLRAGLARGFPAMAAMVSQLGLARPSVTNSRMTRLLSAEMSEKIASALSARDEADLYGRLLQGLGTGRGILARPDAASKNPATDWNALPGNFLQKMMYSDFKTYLPTDILAKVDRAAMHVALETRIPFLDVPVIDFAWALPVNMKITSGRGKLILRKILQSYVPDTLMERPKQGFGLPIGEWLRGPLRPWAENLLDPARIRGDGFFDAKAVSQLWSQHLHSQRKGQPRIWPVLMFNAWMDARTP